MVVSTLGISQPSYFIGILFLGKEEFAASLEEFLDLQNQGKFNPRDYIQENLTLAKCAFQYAYHLRGLVEIG